MAFVGGRLAECKYLQDTRPSLRPPRFDGSCEVRSAAERGEGLRWGLGHLQVANLGFTFTSLQKNL